MLRRNVIAAYETTDNHFGPVVGQTLAEEAVVVEAGDNNEVVAKEVADFPTKDRIDSVFNAEYMFCVCRFLLLIFKKIFI